MRPLHYLARLSPEERRELRRWHLAVAGVYVAFFLILLAGVVARVNLAPSDTVKGVASDTPPVTAQPVLTSSDVGITTVSTRVSVSGASR